MAKETSRTWKPIERVALLMVLMLARSRTDMNRIYTWFARATDRRPAESKVEKVGHLRAVVDMDENECLVNTMYEGEEPRLDWQDEDGRGYNTHRVMYSAYRLLRGRRTGHLLSWYEEFRFIPAYVRKIRRFRSGEVDRDVIPLRQLLWVMCRDESDYAVIKAEVDAQLERTAEDRPDPSGDYRGDTFSDFGCLQDALAPFVGRNDPRTCEAYWCACVARAETVDAD